MGEWNWYLPWIGWPRTAWNRCHVHSLVCDTCFCPSRLRSSWILGSASLIATFANKIESERLTLAMNRSASKGLKYMPWTLAGVWHMFLPFEAELFMDSGEWINHCHLCHIKLRDWVLSMNKSTSKGMKHMACTLAGELWHVLLPFEAEVFMDFLEWYRIGKLIVS